MNPPAQIQFDGLKAVEINGKRFEIAEVNIVGSEEGKIAIAVRLSNPVEIATVHMFFDPKARKS